MFFATVRGVDDASLGSPFRVPDARISTAKSPPSNIALPRLPQTAVESVEKEDGDVAADFVENPITVAGNHENGTAGGCRCRQSHCCKMYCECFVAGRYCTSLCECIECENCVQNEAALGRIRTGIRRRNLDAFTPKITNVSGIRKHARGCRCARSKCLRRYCECYREGMSCTADCECKDCHNGRNATSVVPEIRSDLDMEGGFITALQDFLDGQ